MWICSLHEVRQRLLLKSANLILKLFKEWVHSKSVSMLQLQCFLDHRTDLTNLAFAVLQSGQLEKHALFTVQFAVCMEVLQCLGFQLVSQAVFNHSSQKYLSGKWKEHFPLDEVRRHCVWTLWAVFDQRQIESISWPTFFLCPQVLL